ncbi:MAG: type II toxin-antitoxin system PemK/MazF family toxin [Burkholderiales bacterium]|nr:type II toxin-antitoxin system PemK/MazF family toxin [Burkholderiales bacterium]
MTRRAAAPPTEPARGARSTWIPERQHLIWIDCNPQAGSEMRDFHPLLVLSPAAFNARTGLVIGLPMTTAPYNVGNPFAVAAGPVRTRGRDKPSFVLCHQPKSFDWRARGAKPHPLGRVGDEVFAEACAVLNQIVEIG